MADTHTHDYHNTDDGATALFAPHMTDVAELRRQVANTRDRADRQQWHDDAVTALDHELVQLASTIQLIASVIPSGTDSAALRGQLLRAADQLDSLGMTRRAPMLRLHVDRLELFAPTLDADGVIDRGIDELAGGGA